MYESPFHKRVLPLSPSDISLLRTRMRCGLVPNIPGPRIPLFQGLLLFSLTYGAGAEPQELAKMRIACMLDADGNPASHVRFEPSVTKHGTTRRVPMHPDVHDDLVKFREFFPAKHWIAFRSHDDDGPPDLPPFPASALTSWFRALYREAELGQFSARSGRKTFLEIKRRAA